ncbi:MAG: ATP-binding protein [Gammaproteobacteria bacterium]|nr:ATP-binding protein [Gammaproteobacteria bacterium]
MLKREDYKIVLARLKENRHFIQAIIGPRQVGKTTLALQVMQVLNLPSHYASADEPGLHQSNWLEQQWEVARLQIQRPNQNVLLVLDEIQKITEWSTQVKRLWDEDTRAKRFVKVLLLGSAPLLIQKGLSESLAGRFEVLPIRHWTYKEMHTAFKWSIEQYIYYGGYPGAATLISDETRWKHYIRDSLIETTISKDILSLTHVQKPALLRQLFYLGCLYSGQILSYQKMTGQLQDAGNTTTLSHYLELLSASGLLTGLQKYAGQVVRQRGSSPKFLVQNTALLTASSGHTFLEAQKDREFWGRLLESAIGAYLFNQTVGKNINLFYWRDGNEEVDFILQSGKKLIAIEVKSGKSKEQHSGMAAFQKKFNPYRILLVGNQGMKPEQFLSMPVEKLFSNE